MQVQRLPTSMPRATCVTVLQARRAHNGRPFVSSLIHRKLWEGGRRRRQSRESSEFLNVCVMGPR